MCKRLFKQFKEDLVYVKDAKREVKNFEHHWIKCNTQTQQEALQNHSMLISLFLVDIDME